MLRVMRSLPMVGVTFIALASIACGQDAPRFDAPGSAPAKQEPYPVEIVAPPGLGLVDVAHADARGQRSGIPCATCHEAGSTDALADREGHPQPMHAELLLEHGELGCSSCHDGESPGHLVLAGGERVPMANYMRLCAQCHGPQYRDYKHGSHGGMKGYWDLRRGPRTRNGCIACHAAHAPAYPQVIPAPQPKDRFLEPKNQAGSAFEQRWEGDQP